MTTHRSTYRALLLTIGAMLLVLALGGGHAEARSVCSNPHATPYTAITCTWPTELRTNAKRVAHCESTADATTHAKRDHLGRWARNGQHWGMFQLGTRERNTHGRYNIGSRAVIQARSAYRLYVSRGWAPWAWSGSKGSHCHNLS